MLSLFIQIIVIIGKVELNTVGHIQYYEGIPSVLWMHHCYYGEGIQLVLWKIITVVDTISAVEDIYYFGGYHHISAVEVILPVLMIFLSSTEDLPLYCIGLPRVKMLIHVLQFSL